MKIILTILIGLMTGLLMACNLVLVVDSTLVKKALELQLNLSQQQVYQQFTSRDSRPDLELERVKIGEVKSLNLDQLPTFVVRGTYDLRLKYPQQEILRKNYPYLVYIQEQKEGKTWRLLRPENPMENGVEGKETRWLSYLIESLP